MYLLFITRRKTWILKADAYAVVSLKAQLVIIIIITFQAQVLANPGITACKKCGITSTI